MTTRVSTRVSVTDEGLVQLEVSIDGEPVLSLAAEPSAMGELGDELLRAVAAAHAQPKKPSASA